MQEASPIFSYNATFKQAKTRKTSATRQNSIRLTLFTIKGFKAEKMEIEIKNEFLEELFSPWKEQIGKDYLGYRNHVYRMIHFCFELRECTEEEKTKIMIAGVFHDIGLWTEKTLDYLEPSVLPAMHYLKENNKQEWSEEIRLMILEHHKLRSYTDPKFPLVEVFRKGDLIDFSLGIYQFGVKKEVIRAVKSAFPNEGFHKGLIKKAGKWILRHPFNPLPMMRW